jgi:CDP-diglyceride synthetase
MRTPLTHPYHRSVVAAWRPSPTAERWLAAMIGVPLLVWLLARGATAPWLVHGAFACLAAATAREVARTVISIPALRAPLARTAAWTTGVTYVAAASGALPNPVIAVALGLLVAAVSAALRPAPLAERSTGVEKLSFTVVVALLPWLAVGGLFALRPAPAMLDLALAIAWTGDFGTRLFGGLLGRHRVAPALRPELTWEGAALGLGCAVAAALALRRYGPLADVPADFLVVAAVLGSVSTQAGSLLKGLYRRAHLLRDEGIETTPRQWLLDRLDSLLFCAPTIWLLATLLELGAGP